MRKTFFYLITLSLSILVGVQMYHYPGYVLISLGQWSLEMPVWFALASIFVLFIILNGISQIIHAFASLKYQLHRYKNRLSIKRCNQMTKQGLIDFTEGNWSKAENQLIKASVKSDTPLINYLAAAKAAQEQGNFKKRDQYLREAQTSMPDAKIAIELTQAQLLLANKQFEQTLATLKHLHTLLPKHPYVLKLLLKVYIELKDYEQMIQILPLIKKQKLISIKAIESIEEIAYCGHFVRQSKTQSLKEVQKTWQSYPKTIRQKNFLIARYALFLIEQNEVDDAEKIIREALKVTWDASLTTLYGKCIANSNKQIAFLKKQLGFYPQKTEILEALGKHCQKEKLWGQALDYLSQSAKEKPSAALYFELAHVAKKLGNQEKAEAYQQKALNYSQQMANALIENLKEAPSITIDDNALNLYT